MPQPSKEFIALYLALANLIEGGLWDNVRARRKVTNAYNVLLSTPEGLQILADAEGALG
jgi:hypothetical protein